MIFIGLGELLALGAAFYLGIKLGRWLERKNK